MNPYYGAPIKVRIDPPPPRIIISGGPLLPVGLSIADARELHRQLGRVLAEVDGSS